MENQKQPLPVGEVEEDTMEETIFDRIKKLSGPTIAENYGLKEEEFKELVKEVYATTFSTEDESEAIAQLFPQLDARDRAKMIIWSRAFLRQIYCNREGL